MLKIIAIVFCLLYLFEHYRYTKVKKDMYTLISTIMSGAVVAKVVSDDDDIDKSL